jgi:tetratricopeptide (TPR) repeat protein
VTALTASRHFPLASALPWAFLFGGFALYGAGASPGLSILDSGEFLGVAATLGVAHPTGYPLYALLAQVATLFPWGEKAILMNLVSAAGGAGAAFFMALAAGEVGRQLELRPGARAAAIAAAGLLTLAGRTLWSVSTLAEVYALNACLWAGLLWAALRVRRTAAARELYVLALLGGLSLANHMTIVLFFPAVILISWPGRERARALARALPLAAVVFLAGVSINLYTPLRAAGKPLFNWNDPSTLGSLYAHLTAFQYSGNFLSEGVAGVRDALRQYGAAVLSNGTPLAAFGAPALVWLWAKRLRLVAAALVVYYAGYLSYCAVYSIPDIYYYFIPLHLVVVFVAAAGVGAVADVVARRVPRGRLAVAVGAAALVLSASAWAFAANAGYGHRRGFIFAETYGRRLLATLTARAIFFPSGDTNTFITWYNVYARGMRPDLVIVDQVRLASRGYLTALARRNPGLVVPEEAEVMFMAEKGLARGEYDADDVIFASSDDFILPEVIAGIIAENAEGRRMFWGLGDPGDKLKRYFVPYDLVMEVVTEDPPPAEIRRRGQKSIDALTGLLAYIEKEDAAEVRDPLFRKLLAVFYSGLSSHLANRGIFLPQEKLFASYIRLAPDDVNGYQNMGSIYLVTGRPEEAVDYYRRALKLAPANATLRARLARALLAAGRVDEAAKVAADLEGGEVEGEYIQAVIYRERGELAKALAAFAAAEPYRADDAEFWWELGLTHDAAGDYRAAGEAYDKSIGINPYNARAYTARGVNYLKRGDRGRAAADFEAAVALEPRDAQAHYNLACIYSLRGSAEEAMEHLAVAVFLKPGRYAAMAREDPDLAGGRELPAFEEALAAGAAAE